MDGLDSLRRALRGEHIHLSKRKGATDIFDLADAFVNLSRENETIQTVHLFPVTDTGDDASGNHRYAVWDKIAEGVGNLQALCEISIMHSHAVGHRTNFYDCSFLEGGDAVIASVLKTNTTPEVPRFLLRRE
jgi:hypothetical protein